LEQSWPRIRVNQKIIIKQWIRNQQWVFVEHYHKFTWGVFCVNHRPAEALITRMAKEMLWKWNSLFGNVAVLNTGVPDDSQRRDF
jgi:hypothetical protein